MIPIQKCQGDISILFMIVHESLWKGKKRSRESVTVNSFGV